MNDITNTTQANRGSSRGIRLVNRLRPRSGYDIVAVIAMFAALGTGGAYAAGWTGADILDETLTSADIQNLSLQGEDMKPGTITGTEIADGTLDSPDIKDGSISGVDVADNSLTGADVNESTLTGVKVSGLSTTTWAPSQGGSAYEQQASVSCPSGKKAVGVGYKLDGIIGTAQITQLRIYDTSVYALAHEVGVGGSTNNWSVSVQARCANAE